MKSYQELTKTMLTDSVSYLLDTHYVLWALFEPKRIPERVIAIFDSDEIRKYVSPITFWEISLKYSIGKLELQGTNPKEVYDNILSSGFEILPLDDGLLVSFFQLPQKEKHKDPFDRMLIWQAINNEMTFITADKKIKEYVIDGLKIESGS
jgi:PIN domain nuclease of toxin-antitoxin system